jgi:hypothetical protein
MLDKSVQRLQKLVKRVLTYGFARSSLKRAEDTKAETAHFNGARHGRKS